MVQHQALTAYIESPLPEEGGDFVARLPGRNVGHFEALGRHEDVLVVALLALVVAEVQARLVDEAGVVCRLKERVLISERGDFISVTFVLFLLSVDSFTLLI